MSVIGVRRSLRLLSNGVGYRSSSTVIQRRLSLSVLESRNTLATTSGTGPGAVCRLHYMGTWTDHLRRWQSGNQGENKDSKDKDESKKGKSESEAKEDQKSEVSEVDEKLAEKDAQIQANEAKIKELEDKFLRALAETENTRTRLGRQIEEAKKFGIQDFSKGIVEVADLLDTAMASVKPDDLKDNTPLLNLFEGLKLTEAELQKVMSKNSLERIGQDGVDFDPNIHEALFEVPGDKSGTVAVVSRVGYTLHGRTIRPARVGVVKSTDS